MDRIEKCIYYLKDEQIEWVIENDNDIALMTKKTSNSNLAKKMNKEILSNLDIFFSDLDFTGWDTSSFNESSVNDDTVVIISEGVSYKLSKGDELNQNNKKIFLDLYNYFNIYFENEIKPITLSFHSFDGGGPIYEIKLENKGIVTWYSQIKYYNDNHENLCGAGYDVIYTLYPMRKGKTTAIVKGDSPICFEPDRQILIDVDDNFNITYDINEIKPKGFY